MAIFEDGERTFYAYGYRAGLRGVTVAALLREWAGPAPLGRWQAMALRSGHTRGARERHGRSG